MFSSSSSSFYHQRLRPRKRKRYVTQVSRLLLLFGYSLAEPSDEATGVIPLRPRRARIAPITRIALIKPSYTSGFHHLHMYICMYIYIYNVPRIIVCICIVCMCVHVSLIHRFIQPYHIRTSHAPRIPAKHLRAFSHPHVLSSMSIVFSSISFILPLCFLLLFFF